MEKLRILVIDDHPEVLRQIELRLSQEENFEVFKATSCDYVFSHLMTHKPDVLLIDPFVDKSSYIKTLKWVQEMLPTVTIIVLTTVLDAAAQVELNRIGVKFILEKKLASEQLIDTLRLVEAIRNGQNNKEKN